MKIFISLFMLIINLELENYIGTHFSEFPYSLSSVPNDNLDDKHYQADLEFYFLGKLCDYMYVTTNEKDIIISILFSLKGEMNTEFYQLMLLKYDNPDKMFKMESIRESQLKEEDSFIAKTEKGNAMSCTFDENPLIIEWEKNSFNLRITRHPDNNHFAISFKLKKEEN